MSRRLAIPVIIAAMILLITTEGFSYNAQEAGETTLEQIFNQFVSRQNGFGIGKFEMNGEVITPKGMLIVRNRAKGGPFPTQTVTNPRKIEVSLSREGLRYAYEGPIWTEEVLDFVNQSFVSVMNGNEYKTFTGNAFGEHFPVGIIMKKNTSNPDTGNLYIRPVLCNFCSIHGSMAQLSLSRCVLKSGFSEIEGQKCYAIEQSVTGYKETFWVDPKREFIILRAQKEYGKGMAFEQLDVSYARDKNHGYVPSGWRGLLKYSFDGGKTMELMESFQLKVTHFQIGIPLPPQEFDLKFPVGTWVEDYNSDKGYIQLEKGIRIITDAERTPDITYRDLVNSDSGKAAAGQSTTNNTKRNAIRIIVAALLIGLAAVGFWFRMRRKNMH